MEQAESRAEAKSRAEASALCGRLRARGDDDSLLAAAMIEGTLDAFADLVAERAEMREQAENAQRNLNATMDLWARVPASVRHQVVHGPRAMRAGA